MLRTSEKAFLSDRKPLLRRAAFLPTSSYLLWVWPCEEVMLSIASATLCL